MPPLEALFERTRAELKRGRSRAALRAARRALILARRTGERALLARAEFECGQALSRFGRHLDAERKLRRAARLYLEAGLVTDARRPLTILAVERTARGDLPGARRILERVLAEAERSGDRLVALAATRNLAYLESLSGRAREGWQAAVRGVRLARALDERTVELLSVASLAATAAVRGRPRWAVRAAGRAIEELRALGEKRVLAAPLSARALAVAMTGAFAEARADLALAVRIAERTENHVLAAGCRVLGARIALRAGEGEAARRPAAEALPVLLAARQLHAAAEAALVLAETCAAEGDLDGAEKELATLRKVLCAGRGFERAEGLYELGLAGVSRLRGDGEAAARALARARRKLGRLGRLTDRIALDLEEAAQEAASGVANGRAAERAHAWERRARAVGLAWPPLWHPRGAVVAPVRAQPHLSRAERNVIDCLRLGLPNKEIARRLYISPQTVRTHLVRIFRKLGVRSRLQAVLTLRRLEGGPS